MIFRIVVGVFFSVVLLILIVYARGYRIDIQNTQISTNGLIAVTSSPKTAQILIDGALRGVTDSSIYLSPGEYVVRITKDGYFPWTKKVTVRGEIVQSVDATLYPINASLSPLTNIGVQQAVPFGTDNKKILLFTPNPDVEAVVQTEVSPRADATNLADSTRPGIFVYDPRVQTVSIFPTLTKLTEYENFPEHIAPGQTTVVFSPDFDQVILFTGIDKDEMTDHMLVSQYDVTNIVPAAFSHAYLLSVNEANNTPLDVTDSAFALVEAWSTQKRSYVVSLLSGYDQDLQDLLIENTRIVDISVDRTRLLYQATASASLRPILKKPLIGANQTPEERTIEPPGLYVYDVREDRNYQVISSDALSMQQGFPMFHPNSKNIILNEDRSIAVMDYDGLNRQKLYSGPYYQPFFSITNDGRVLVLTKFNQDANQYYDLYAVGIR